ncbi:MAG: DUF6677 family protein [Planctomycetota bacterium]
MSAPVVRKPAGGETDAEPESVAIAKLWHRGALVLAWLVPGLGHFVIGQRRRGLVLCVLVGGAYVAGLGLSSGEAISRELHPYSFYAQIGMGVTLPILRLDPAHAVVKHGGNAITELDVVPRRLDTGLLFCNIAGLLNMLVILDLIDQLLKRATTRGR